jgi:hypothetical protein
MDSVARELATVVNHVAGVHRPRRDETALHTVALQVARVGDLVDMLKLPDDQTLFEPQSIVLQQVQDATGALWQPDETAEVLLLGDSFTNVFSQPEMGWGEAAGLAPHLALALGDGHGVDVIAQNDSGAFATRQELARALAAGTDRLQGKRVVVWELAARELSVGNWKELDWEPPTAAVTSEEHVDVTP